MGWRKRKSDWAKIRKDISEEGGLEGRNGGITHARKEGLKADKKKV